MNGSLIIDWLGREGGEVLSWWLLVTLAGAAAWPLLFRVLGGLPDRGYTLARAAGLMLTGFLFWFLGSLGLLHNTPGAMVLAWLLVLVIGLVVFLRGERPPVRAWLREHRALIVLTEVLFLVLLFGWAAFRAHNPEMRSTENPMEIMFLNGIRASEAFPPRDPWLSGYAISYYYFGYVLMAMLADLSGVASGTAFGITIGLVFALTGIGALGGVYNLVRARGPDRRWRGGSVGAALAAGVLGLCFLILMGNLGTALVELPYRGYTPGVGAGYFDFWDVEERDGTQIDSDGDGTPDWDDEAQHPDNWRYWWWFRYSRVIHDRDLQGDPIGAQPIAEFPNFSFVLADLHPHVLALPFAVLAVGLALNLVLGGRPLHAYEYPLYAIWVGGMVFMNSWDLIYLPLLIGAEAVRRLAVNRTGALRRADLFGILRFAAIMIGLTLALYLPWLISFTSQAGGVLPNVIFPTQWQQLFLQFGVFLVILTVLLAVEMRRARGRFNWQAGLSALVIAAVAGILVVAVLGFAAWERDEVRGSVYAAIGPGRDLGDVVPDVLERRLGGLPGELLLLGMIVVVVGRLFARPVYHPAPDEPDDEQAPEPVAPYSGSTAFALLLVAAGAVLILAPDFVYLRDNFGVRMNTVFKLYYQGWILFSLAAAYAVWSVLAGGPERVEAVRKTRHDGSPLLVGRVAFGAVVIVLFAAGMLYPVFATRSRALVEDTNRRAIAACEPGDPVAQGGACPDLPPLTLNGVPAMVGGEFEAVQCLAALVPGGRAVLAEAPGGAYAPDYGRFSGLTGIPTLIGWQNHERQWRGETYPAVTDARTEGGQFRDRATDVQELYTTLDWERAWAIIDRYGIDYIVVGNAERQMASQLAGGDPSVQRDNLAGLDKFGTVFAPVCASGETQVFRVAPG